MIRFTTTVRGVEIEVSADMFDGDPSVGIGYGPEELSAVDEGGAPFELTDEESERLGIEATEIWLEDCDDY